MNRDGNRSTAPLTPSGSSTPSSASSSTGASIRCRPGARWASTPSGTGTTCTTRSRTTSGGSSTRQNYGENFEYKDFAPQFRAELFDADQWADIFARSGAKYIVPTSKHHEGFCLWPSAEASRTWGRPWNAVEIGPKRDLMGELADGDAQARAEVRLLLLALRVVQPALAQRPQAATSTSTCSRSSRTWSPATSRRSSSATANGTCPPRTGRARNCWPGCSTNRLQGRGGGQRPLGQGLPAQARRLLDHRIRRRPEGRQPSLGGKPRHGLFLRLQPRRADRRLQDRPASSSSCSATW